MPLDDSDHNMLDRGLRGIANSVGSPFDGDELDYIKTAIEVADDRITEELSAIRVALEKIGKELAVHNEHQESK